MLNVEGTRDGLVMVEIAYWCSYPFKMVVMVVAKCFESNGICLDYD